MDSSKSLESAIAVTDDKEVLSQTGTSASNPNFNGASSKLTDDMIKEEEKLHEASIANEAETKRLNMEKMKSMAQEECYRRLSFLLEKSKYYTMHVHQRMQGQKAQMEELQRQIKEQRLVKALAMAAKKSSESEKSSKSGPKSRSTRNLSGNDDTNVGKIAQQLSCSVDENDNSVTDSRDIMVNDEVGMKIEIGVKLKVKKDKIYIAKVLKVDDEEKKYYVHFDGWSKRFDEWICRDIIVGRADEGQENSKRRGRKSVASTNILLPKQPAEVPTEQLPPAEQKRGRKRKFEDSPSTLEVKRGKFDADSELSASSQCGITPTDGSTQSSQPDSSSENISSQATSAEDCDDQPVLLTEGKLRSYQLDGVRWLKMLYENGVNGILADEMGLGKTIQCIALVCHLMANGVEGPFFLCAPLSTIPNWIAELTRFAPKVPHILYHGSRPDRAALRHQIRRRWPVNYGGVTSSYPFVVTSYEIAMNDREFLMNHPWKLLIVDEGHRIKNSNCRLIKELKMYNSSNRLLLTGTPLQNNMAELWSLLNFLIPEIFDSLGSFETWFDVAFLESNENAHEQIVYEEQRNNTISMLHQILTPFMLRRLKSDVDFVIPPKREVVVYAPLFFKQQEMYRCILDKTIAQLVGGPKESQREESPERDVKGRPVRKNRRQTMDLKAMFDDNSDDDNGNSRILKQNAVDGDDDIEKWAELVMKYHQQADDMRNAKSKKDESPASSVVHVQLRNSLAMLRRCCNHPYLIEHPTDDDGQLRIDEQIVTSCGKLMLLDKMLTELKRNGHKVLIFSQMTQMMDILEDYCVFRGHAYCRLDGRMKMSDRQSEIERFASEEVFIFLLSTRAGGLGINLTQADTVIIYDSDWNPQCDLQAQDRCHRIGQNRPVIVYRLVTANTVDQKIVERASAKRKLEKLVIHKGKFKSSTDSFKTDFEPISPQELLALLKESDHQEERMKNADCSAIRDDDLMQLLDRTDLIKRWTRRLKGNCDETSENAKNVEGVFQVVSETWDDPSVKSVKSAGDNITTV